MCDDVFDEEEESCLPEENEWRRLKQARIADGYRDGLEKGEGDQLQDGFNAGYRSAVRVAFRAAHLRGAVSALLGLHATRQEPLFPHTIEEKLQELLQKTVSLEKKLPSENGGKISDVPESVSQPQTKDSETKDSCCGGQCTKDNQNGPDDISVSCQTKSVCETKETVGNELNILEDQHKRILREIGMVN